MHFFINVSINLIGEAAMFISISASSLKSVDFDDVACYLKERERYGVGINAKKAEFVLITALFLYGDYWQILTETFVKHGHIRHRCPRSEHSRSIDRRWYQEVRSSNCFISQTYRCWSHCHRKSNRTLENAEQHFQGGSAHHALLRSMFWALWSSRRGRFSWHQFQAYFQAAILKNQTNSSQIKNEVLFTVWWDSWEKLETVILTSAKESVKWHIFPPSEHQQATKLSNHLGKNKALMHTIKKRCQGSSWNIFSVFFKEYVKWSIRNYMLDYKVWSKKEKTRLFKSYYDKKCKEAKIARRTVCFQ